MVKGSEGATLYTVGDYFIFFFMTVYNVFITLHRIL